jgi:hypothetical protein
MQSPGLFREDVDLDAARLAIVLQVGTASAVYERLHDLAGDPALEERAAQRMRAQMIGIANAEQVYSWMDIERLGKRIAG